MDSINYQYDMVLLAYCLNDIDHFRGIDTYNTYRRIQQFEGRLPLIAKKSYFLNTLAFRYFALNDKDFMNYSNTVLDDYQGYSWSKQKDAIKDLQEYLEDRNGKLVVTIFPFLQMPADDYKFYEIHEQLSTYLDSLSLPQINLLNVYKPSLGKNLTVNNFDAHPNERAHQLAADEIIRFLTPVMAD
jgi:hypothetical protein